MTGAERAADQRGALLLAGLAGVLVTGQARVNGELATTSGSAVVAALMSFLVGSVAVAVAVAVSAPARAGLGRAVRPGSGGAPWWWWLGGLVGATLVGVSAYAVGKTGVALLTVLIVAGITTGALVVDQLGLGPAGRQRITGPRLAGAALAVAAVALSGLGSLRSAGVVLLVGVVLAGAATSAQQAVNGQLRRHLGSPQTAALVNFAVGSAALGAATAVLALTGRLGDVTLGGPWWQWLGGLAGAVFIVLSAALVRRIGVLRLSLASVAGQVAGAVLLDLVAPPEGQGLRAATVAACVLTVVAVAVAGRGTRTEPVPA